MSALRTFDHSAAKWINALNYDGARSDAPSPLDSALPRSLRSSDCEREAERKRRREREREKERYSDTIR